MTNATTAATPTNGHANNGHTASGHVVIGHAENSHAPAPQADPGSQKQRAANCGNGAVSREGRKDALVLALAVGKSLKQAAEAAGVSQRTAWTWSREEFVQGRVVYLREQMSLQALGVMTRGMTEAARTLRKLLRSTNEAVSLGAARSLIDLTLRLREGTELQRRMADVERTLHANTRAATMRGRILAAEEIASPFRCVGMDAWHVGSEIAFTVTDATADLGERVDKHISEEGRGVHAYDEYVYGLQTGFFSLPDNLPRQFWQSLDAPDAILMWRCEKCRMTYGDACPAPEACVVCGGELRRRPLSADRQWLVSLDDWSATATVALTPTGA